MSQSVAFTAVLAHGVTLGLHQAVEFDKAMTNVGNAYVSRDGQLTVPVDGLHDFCYNMLSSWFRKCSVTSIGFIIDISKSRIKEMLNPNFIIFIQLSHYCLTSEIIFVPVYGCESFISINFLCAFEKHKHPYICLDMDMEMV
jgi:hypothetical protein